MARRANEFVRVGDSYLVDNPWLAMCTPALVLHLQMPIGTLTPGPLYGCPAPASVPCCRAVLFFFLISRHVAVDFDLNRVICSALSIDHFCLAIGNSFAMLSFVSRCRSSRTMSIMLPRRISLVPLPHRAHGFIRTLTPSLARWNQVAMHPLRSF
jgi:hypothetical protein